MLIGCFADKHDHIPHLCFLETACCGGQVVGTGNHRVEDKIPRGIRFRTLRGGSSRIDQGHARTRDSCPAGVHDDARHFAIARQLPLHEYRCQQEKHEC